MLFYLLLILITGIVSIIIGFVFIIKPELLIRSLEIGNKVLITDEQIARYPRALGVVLLVISIFILYVAVNY